MQSGSVQQNVGERAVGIQTMGDGNTVVVFSGTSELHMSRKHSRRAEPRTEIDLMRVDLRATNLVGRDEEKAALLAWTASKDRLVSVRCLIGRGGAGKTRLAIELCEAAELDGWTAGFAQHKHFPEFAKRAAEWRWNKPTLVVIDYAAALGRELRVWLEVLVQREKQPDDQPLRILLLERHAEAGFGWWADLICAISLSDPEPAELADPMEPVVLKSLAAVEDRRALVAETMRLAALISRMQLIPRPPLPGEHADFDRHLSDDGINSEPLYLIMAGAEAVRTGASTVLALSSGDLAERVACRERKRLENMATQWGFAKGLAEHLAICVTLQGGCGAEDALLLVREEREAMSFPLSFPATVIVNHLAEMLPDVSRTAIDPIRPDLVGEAFVLLGLQKYRLFPQRQAGIVDRAFQRAGGKVTATLVRVAQDFGHGDAAHPSVVWLGHQLDRIEDLSALTAIVRELPDQTLALRELAARVQERIVNATARQAEDDPNKRLVHANSLIGLSTRLSALGRHEQALAAAREAVSLSRKLEAHRPDAFRHNLAMSLNSLANGLSDLGHREQALAAAEEAASLYRELAAQRPDAFQPELAVSLNNLANRLRDLGRGEAALVTAQEAVSLYRELAAQRPDSFRPNLATSLHNLAIKLSELGLRELALAAAKEATAIHRELAARRSDAFRPNLAMSLTNLATTLSEVGSRELALVAAKEAALLYRELAAQRPDAFRPALAGSLNNLAAMLSGIGCREPALGAADEAALLYRELATQRPDAFRPNLAASLNNLATMLSELGSHQQALAAAREAVSLYRELAAQQPDAFRPDLAGSLNNLANRLSDAGCRELALAAVSEAASLYRKLAAQQPEAFRPDLAMSLYNLASILSAVGRREPAFAMAQEAVLLYRQLAGQRPDAFQPNLAMSLTKLASSLDDLGRHEPALTAAEDAIAMLSPAFMRNVAAFRTWMTSTIQTYLRCCEHVGRAPDARLVNPVLSHLQQDYPGEKQ